MKFAVPQGLGACPAGLGLVRQEEQAVGGCRSEAGDARACWVALLV